MTTAERTLANPLYAVVGVGDLAFKQITETIDSLRERTEEASDTVQTRLTETRTRLTALPDEVPSTIEELRTKYTPEELRKIAEGYLDLATDWYNNLAERGEETVERLRQQPAVQENLTRVEKAYNDAVDLTEDTLGVVSSQTRAVGERAAKLATLVGGKVEEAGSKVGEAVEDAGAAIELAGEAIKEEAADAAQEIDGAAGTVEGKARTANSSPAKKIAAAKKAPAKKAPAKKATS